MKYILIAGLIIFSFVTALMHWPVNQKEGHIVISGDNFDFPANEIIELIVSYRPNTKVIFITQRYANGGFFGFSGWVDRIKIKRITVQINGNGEIDTKILERLNGFGDYRLKEIGFKAPLSIGGIDFYQTAEKKITQNIQKPSRYNSKDLPVYNMRYTGNIAKLARIDESQFPYSPLKLTNKLKRLNYLSFVIDKQTERAQRKLHFNIALPGTTLQQSEVDNFLLTFRESEKIISIVFSDTTATKYYFYKEQLILIYNTKLEKYYYFEDNKLISHRTGKTIYTGEKLHSKEITQNLNMLLANLEFYKQYKKPKK